MIVLPIVSLVLFIKAKQSIGMVIDAPNIVEKNAPVKVKLIFTNSSYIPVIQSHLTLAVQHSFYPGSPDYHFICGISARKGTSVEFTLNPAYAGSLSFSVKAFKCWDFTGLFGANPELNTHKEISVFPSITEADISLAMVGGAGLVELAEQDEKGNDSSTVIDTRDYQPGDKLQRIHWKLSTKLDKLLVKEYGAMSSQDLLVILELSHGDFTKNKKSDSYKQNRISFDAVFDAYYTLANRLLKEKRPFMTGWYSPASGELKISEITTKEELDETLIMLYYEKPSSEPSQAKLLAKSVLDEYGNFLYVHPTLPKAMFYDNNEKDVIYEQLSDSGEALAVISLIGSI